MFGLADVPGSTRVSQAPRGGPVSSPVDENGGTDRICPEPWNVSEESDAVQVWCQEHERGDADQCEAAAQPQFRLCDDGVGKFRVI